MQPSMTCDRRPCSSYPPPDVPLAATSSAAFARRATVATSSPLAMAGRCRCFASSSSLASSAGTASATVAKYGAQSSARPNSSNTTASSAQPNPAPPYLSGIAMPCRPSWLAMTDQTSRSKPCGVAMRRRTSASGDVFVAKSRTDWRSSSCSAGPASGMGGPFARISTKPLN